MQIANVLINWYTEHKRDLPWRNTHNPYHIWLSEIILQQTQVQQGLPYYNAFIETFPTVFDLAASDEDTVLKLWQGLGYYSRARHLHNAAKYIVHELDGHFPNTYNDILKLKGVGDYTASAIASIAFNEVTAVVDGNVYRVLSRVFGIKTPINSSKGNKEFKALASQLINKKQPATFNQAIMEFGARQCKPKNPNCSICPLQTKCVAYAKGTIDKLPVKLKKLTIKKRFFNYLVFVDATKHTVLEKRTEKGIWQNLYQFPLVETAHSIGALDFEKYLKNSNLLKDIPFEFSLYNTSDIVHKLSHQHLYTKFWIIETNRLPFAGIPISELEVYPTPVLISNFITKFRV